MIENNKIKTIHSNLISRIDAISFLIISFTTVIFFSPVIFNNKSLLIDSWDHWITYVRFVERSQWISQGIIPLWDPQTFTGISNINSVPTTHLLNFQAWLMALIGNHFGYVVCVILFVVFGAFGTYLLCKYRLGIDWHLSLCAGMSVVFGPFIDNTYSGIFTIIPFISFFLYFFFDVIDNKNTLQIIRSGLIASVILSLCLYTQEPRFLEFIFYSTILFIMIFLIIKRKIDQTFIRNAVSFFIPLIVAFLLLSAPLLFPLFFETINQHRLGAGQDALTFNNIPLQQPVFNVLDIVWGNFFPVNMSVFHDGMRYKLLGDYLTFYFSYINIFFFACLLIGALVYRNLNAVEKTIYLMPIAIIGLVFLLPNIPGFMFIWTVLFKTGRFGLSMEVSNFYGILMVFLIIQKTIFDNVISNLQNRFIQIARIVVTAQLITAIFASFALIAIALIANPVIIPYLNSHVNPIQVASLFASFWQRWPFLMMGFVCIGFQLIIFLKIVFKGEGSTERMKYIFFILLFITPLFLSYAYWPFNNSDRSMIQSSDRTFLSSLTILDRVGVADFDLTNIPLTQEEKRNLITRNSASSLEWTTQGYEVATMESVHHFMPNEMHRYIYKMYEHDPYFPSNSSLDRLYFMPQDNNLFHLTGTNYVFSQFDRFNSPFEKVGKYGDYFIYNNKNALPRFYFVDNLAVLENDTVVLDTLATLPYEDVKRTALISAGSPTSMGITEVFNNDNRQITLISYTPNSVILRTNTSSSQYLVLTDTFDNRWKAYLDGIEVPIVRTNYLFRGISVVEGNHSIKFSYEYPEFNIYIFLSFFSLLVITIFVIYLGNSNLLNNK